MSYMLAKYNGNASFPSGDAASVVVMFAIPVAHIDFSSSSSSNEYYYSLAAWCMVLWSCTGRLYILAHYFSDVGSGAMISYLVHRTVSAFGLGIYDMEWWHPLGAATVRIIYEDLVRKVSKIEERRIQSKNTGP